MTKSEFNTLITKYKHAEHRSHQLIGIQLIIMAIISIIGSMAIIMTNRPLDIYITGATISILIILICIIIITEGHNWFNPQYHVYKLAQKYPIDQILANYQQQEQQLVEQLKPINQLPNNHEPKAIHRILKENKATVTKNRKLNNELNELQSIICDLYPDLKYTN